MKPILQTESNECALACLAMISNHYGNQVELRELRSKFSISMKGATLTHLVRHAATMQLAARPLRLELDEIVLLKLPCILHWDMNHFVVLEKISRPLGKRPTLHLLDPAVGRRKIGLDDASSHFTGVALELVPNEHFAAQAPSPAIPLSRLTGKIHGLRRAVAQVILLAVALEVFAIVAPLFNQYVTDEVIVGGDREMLTVLALGFGLAMLIQDAIALARSWFLMRWSIDIGFQWSTRIFSHLTSLPVAFFEKRHLGDIVSRFGSLGAIQSTLTGLLVGSLLDGILAVAALAMMFLYSPLLSAIVIVGVVVYIGLRWAFYGPLRAATQEEMVLSAKESSHFLETMRAITPLKLFGREAERCARWQNLKQDVINRNVETQKLRVIFQVGTSAISHAQTLVLFYAGASLVIGNSLTIGMLFAFSSYASTFSTRIFNLVDMYISVRMLSLHIERLSDIVLEPAETDAGGAHDAPPPAADISLVGVRFRYADGEPWVLDGVTLDIPAGQSVALVGPSGCGKTTLCKIMLGLLAPTEGQVLVGGMPLERIGMRAYRAMVGTVMQDDALLAGSIAENISFFDPHPDQKRIERCAALAAVHDEIATMPMAYRTLVGDMGSSLSGGQKQRILLARALYKDPAILVLDEATSHLDLDNERKVGAALAGLALTRILIAHRPETIRSAERIIDLGLATARAPMPLREPDNACA